MALNRQPNIPDPDVFYAELIEGQRNLSDEQADMMLAKLVLILSNHVGDRAVLSEAIALARDNTLAATGLREPNVPNVPNETHDSALRN